MMFYFAVVRNDFVNFTRDLAALKSITGFLSISQHQLNYNKTNQIGNLHVIQVVNVSSGYRKKDVESKSTVKKQPLLRKLARDSWEQLELFTVPRPSLEKLRRKFINHGALDRKFLRVDERSIVRIVDGLAMDFEENLPDIFRKKGMPKKRLPNVIIIGVKKGGTRALLEMIKLHPQVCSCGPEIHYFDRYYTKGVKWYRDKMPLCYENEARIEKTPSYFVTSGVAKDAFRYSQHLNETLKLLLIVRDPTRRAISDFTQTKATERDHSNRTFEKAAFKQGLDGQQYVNSQWGAIKIGIYSKHLKRWYRYFKPNQIHLVSGETLIKQPYKELKEVEKFLNLPSFIKPQHFVYNKTKGFYCIDKQISQPSRYGNQTHLRCLGRNKGRPHVLISNQTEKLLRDYYRPFNEELYDLTGRNFGWI